MGVWDWIGGSFLLLLGIWDRNIKYLMSFNVLLDETAYSLKYKLIKNIVLLQSYPCNMRPEPAVPEDKNFNLCLQWGLTLEPNDGKQYDAQHRLLHTFIKGKDGWRKGWDWDPKNMKLEYRREGDAQLKGRNDRNSSVPKQHVFREMTIKSWRGY